MKISVVTLFPELIASASAQGVIGAALKSGLWSLTTVNPREFTSDVHHTVDDKLYGGSDGMLMMAEPLAQSVAKVKLESPDARVVHLSPRGRVFTDRIAREWASDFNSEGNIRPLALIATRYAGADERFIEECCDDEISIGDYVVSGGELPALIVMDAVLRHVPGVLGNRASSQADSFAGGLLESAQYTRPREWRGRAVPEILMSGDHAKVRAWEFLSSLMVTLERRPDLIPDQRLTIEKELSEVEKVLRDAGPEIRRALSAVRDLLGDKQ